MELMGDLGSRGAQSATNHGASQESPGGPGNALDFSRQGLMLPPAAIAGLTNSPTPAVKPNTGDPMRLWYTVDTDPRTAKKISLDTLNYNSIDQAVYIMLQVDCPFAKKFDFINIQDLVFANLRNGMSLMELSDCLRVLAKYAKELLKPSRERYKHWNKIPFSKSGVAQKWTRMEGTAPILHLLGYTHETSKGYVFPLTSYGPPVALIKVLALELAMAAAELSVFYNNRHPKAEVITDMLYSPRAPTAQPNSATSQDTGRNSQPGATPGSFNVMDLLSPNLKTVRDSDGAPDEMASGLQKLQQTDSGTLTSASSYGYSQTDSAESGVPQDFSVNRKRKELHGSEPTDLTTNRNDSRRSFEGRRGSEDFEQNPRPGAGQTGPNQQGLQADPKYATQAQDLSQSRTGSESGARPNSNNGERNDPAKNHSSQQDQTRTGFVQDFGRNMQPMQDFRNPYGHYPRFVPDNHRAQGMPPSQDSLLMSVNALPNLSIFGDMFSNLGAENKD